MSYKTINYEIRNEIAIVTFNRPEQRNAFDLTMRAELADIIADIRENLSLKAAVITGSGGAFCAGGDLKSLSGGKPTAQEGRKRIQALHVWLPELVNLEIPVIAAVDGPAFGAGFNLALAADFVLASTRARFCAVFGRIGLVPDAGGFFLLPRIVGLQRAKDLVFSARSIGAEEARDMSIVYEIHEPDVLQERAIEFAERFRNASREAVGMAKNILNNSFSQDQKTVGELESYAQGIALQSEYHQQAVARFLGKEPLLFNWDELARKGNNNA
jgi:2-(1,2-epoxy-1,2-dihydrophenyl)acetyl-CoA isomerase